MNFDIKYVKSWANRHDVVELSVAGFFGNSLLEIDNEIRRYNKGEKGHLHMLYQISDNGCFCFGYATYFADTGAFSGTSNFAFFLPLDAVKKDKSKEKKYRPFVSMRELTEIIYSKDLGCDNLSVGDSLWIRRKGDKHIHQKLLITSLGYDENDVISILISMNGKSMQQWLDNFEFLAHDEWQPFGAVEDCTGEKNESKGFGSKEHCT